MTVENNIRAILEVVESSRKERERSLDALLEEFHITHLRKSPSMSLSGGERRRLEIARALASRPHYMLLDEPFAGIDPIAVADIQQLVRHLTTRGIGVLVTDHNVRETLKLIDRAYIIHNGEILKHGTADDIIGDSNVRRLYLGEELHALITQECRSGLPCQAAASGPARAFFGPLSLDKQKPGQFDQVVLRHAGPAPAITVLSGSKAPAHGTFGETAAAPVPVAGDDTAA